MKCKPRIDSVALLATTAASRETQTQSTKEATKGPVAAYVSVRGAKLLSSLSRRTLDYAKQRGELPFIRVGKKVLFRVSDLEQWLDAKRVDVRAEVAAVAKVVAP